MQIFFPAIFLQKNHATKRIAFCIALIFFFGLPVFAQVEEEPDKKENRIQSAVDAFVRSHKYKLGIFRFDPGISFRAGFDGNAVFGNIEEKERETDVFIRVVPSISGGLKFGSRAFLRFIEDVHLVYYFKREERRGIFNNTQGEFVTGTPGVLVTIDGGYRRRDSPVDEEIDEPIEHKITHVGGRVEYSATDRIEMYHTVRVSRTTFEESSDVEASDLTLHGRRTISFGTGSLYELTQNVDLFGRVNINQSESLETENSTNSWHVLGGVQLHRPRYLARFALGFGEAHSGEEDRERSNFLMDADINVFVTRRLRIGGTVNRRYEFSFLDPDAIRTTTQGGARFSYAFLRRLTFNGQYTIGTNDYGEDPIQGRQITEDTFQRGQLGLAIRTFKGITVQPGLLYVRRETDIPELDKDLFGYFVDVRVGYSIEF